MWHENFIYYFQIEIQGGNTHYGSKTDFSVRRRLMGRGIAQVFSRNPEYSIVLYDIADNDVLGRYARK